VTLRKLAGWLAGVRRGFPLLTAEVIGI